MATATTELCCRAQRLGYLQSCLIQGPALSLACNIVAINVRRHLDFMQTSLSDARRLACFGAWAAVKLL
jgi:hypothetical protein